MNFFSSTHVFCLVAGLTSVSRQPFVSVEQAAFCSPILVSRHHLARRFDGRLRCSVVASLTKA